MNRLPTLLTVAALIAAPAVAGDALAAGAATAPAAAAAGAASGGASTAFADVPPCHWAAKAVAKVADAGIFRGFPPDPAYDSANALRQVFAGLQCGLPAWSLKFMAGAPAAFGAGGAPPLVRYTLTSRVVSLSANQASLAYRLTAVVGQGGAQRSVERQGRLSVKRTDAGWQVPYPELADLDLPLFPR